MGEFKVHSVEIVNRAFQDWEHPQTVLLRNHPSAKIITFCMIAKERGRSIWFSVIHRSLLRVGQWPLELPRRYFPIKLLIAQLNAEMLSPSSETKGIGTKSKCLPRGGNVDIHRIHLKRGYFRKKFSCF